MYYTCIFYTTIKFPIIIAYFVPFSTCIMQSVQEVYDDTATVSRKHEVIQTVMNDVKTHQATIETNLANMLDARYKSAPINNSNRSGDIEKRKGGERLLKQV